MEILIAQQADIEALAQVEIESKKQSIPECTEHYELDPPSRIQRWQTYFAGSSPQTSKPPRITLKAVGTDGVIIGYISGHLTTRFGIDAEIQSFYILKQEQRKGLGSRLLSGFAKWLHEEGAKTLCVGIKPENKYQSFYIKHGGHYRDPHWIAWKDISGLVKASE